MTQFLQDTEEDFVKRLMDKSLQEARQESKRRENEVAAMIARCHDLDALFTKTYEDNASGKLPDERFMMIAGRYGDGPIALKKKISALQAEIDAQKRHKSSAADFLRMVRKYTEIEELTPTIVNEMIEKIVVHQSQGTGKNKTQQLEIDCNFGGILDMPQLMALPQSVTVDTRQGGAAACITRKAGYENRSNLSVTPIHGMFNIVMNTRHEKLGHKRCAGAASGFSHSHPNKAIL